MQGNGAHHANRKRAYSRLSVPSHVRDCLAPGLLYASLLVPHNTAALLDYKVLVVLACVGAWHHGGGGPADDWRRGMPLPMPGPNRVVQ